MTALRLGQKSSIHLQFELGKTLSPKALVCVLPAHYINQNDADDQCGRRPRHVLIAVRNESGTEQSVYPSIDGEWESQMVAGNRSIVEVRLPYQDAKGAWGAWRAAGDPDMHWDCR